MPNAERLTSNVERRMQNAEPLMLNAERFFPRFDLRVCCCIFAMLEKQGQQDDRGLAFFSVLPSAFRNCCHKAGPLISDFSVQPSAFSL